MRKLLNGLFSCCALVFLASHSVWAVGESSFRKALSRVNVEFLVGGGATNHLIQIGSNDERSACLLVDQGELYLVDPDKQGKAYRAHWFVKPLEEIDTYIDPKHALQEGLGAQQCTFSGWGASLQYTLNLYADFWNKLRLGAGASLFRHQLVKLEPTVKNQESTKLPAYVPKAKVGYSIRPQGIIGYKFSSTHKTHVIASLGLGWDILYGGVGKKRCIDWWTGGAQNLGVTLEHSVSEYIRFCTRLAIDRSNVIRGIDLDKSFANQKVLIGGERRSIMLQVGLGFNAPEVSQCRVSHCKVKTKHHHGGKYYRGSSIFESKDYLDRSLF